jgi:hypothetical protein
MSFQCYFYRWVGFSRLELVNITYASMRMTPSSEAYNIFGKVSNTQYDGTSSRQREDGSLHVRRKISWQREQDWIFRREIREKCPKDSRLAYVPRAENASIS